jgi:hypothetical protein
MAVLDRSAHGLLMTLDGQWRVGGGTLKQGQGVWWAEEPHSLDRQAGQPRRTPGGGAVATRRSRARFSTIFTSDR